MTPFAPGPPQPAPQSGRYQIPAPVVDIRKKAHARIAEKIDLVRVRHKPLSLLRQEAKRVLEQFLDAECSTLTRSDRDKLVDDVLAEGFGFGPLEELFRDEAIKEILVLAAGQIIVRKGEAWQPASVRLRDTEQLRSVITRYAETGESVAGGPAPTGGVDVRLANGFRAIAVVPPEVMQVSPQLLLTRSTAPATPAPTGNSGTIQFSQLASARSGGSGPVNVTPGPRSGNLGTPIPAPASRTPTPTIHAEPPRPVPPSGVIPNPDPFAKLRQRIGEKIIMKFASAGVYDINEIPQAELRKIVHATVIEVCHAEKLGYDEQFQERLALEILAGMNR